MNLINIFWTFLFNTYHFGFSGLFNWRVVFFGPMKGCIFSGSFEFSDFKDKRIVIGKRYTRGIASPNYTLWNVRGNIDFKGEARIPFGSIVEVTENATLIVGDNLRGSHCAKIIVHERIEIKSNVLLAWNAKILDTDFHTLYRDGKARKQTKSIVIGEGSWIGINSVITKGVILGKNVFVGPNITLSNQEVPDDTIVKQSLSQIKNNSSLINE